MILSSAAHPSLEKLELYLLNFLNKSIVAEVELHLLFCDDCRQRTKELEEQMAVLRLALA